MSSRRQGCRQRKNGRAAGSAALLLSCGVRTSELTKPFGPKPSALTVSRICARSPTRQRARAQLSGRTFARQQAQPQRRGRQGRAGHRSRLAHHTAAQDDAQEADVFGGACHRLWARRLACGAAVSVGGDQAPARRALLQHRRQRQQLAASRRILKREGGNRLPRSQLKRSATPMLLRCRTAPHRAEACVYHRRRPTHNRWIYASCCQWCAAGRCALPVREARRAEPT